MNYQILRLSGLSGLLVAWPSNAIDFWVNLISFCLVPELSADLILLTKCKASLPALSHSNADNAYQEHYAQYCYYK